VILADTSAWVEFDRATGSRVHRRVAELVLSPPEGSELTVTESVVMEVLVGARSEGRAEDLRRLLARSVLLPVEPASDFEAAAGMYRQCRRAGVTPRGLLDCLIAAVAWRHRASLLTTDVDLARVAGVVGIDLDDPSAG